MTVSLRFFLIFYGQIEVDVTVRLPHGQHEFNRWSILLLPAKHGLRRFHEVTMRLFNGHFTGATVSVH